MGIEDPTVQKGLWASILAILGGLWWWIRRQVNKVDTLDDRLRTIEQNYADQQTIRSELTAIRSEIGKVHSRCDDIYRQLSNKGHHD